MAVPSIQTTRFLPISGSHWHGFALTPSFCLRPSAVLSLVMEMRGEKGEGIGTGPPGGGTGDNKIPSGRGEGGLPPEKCTEG